MSKKTQILSSASNSSPPQTGYVVAIDAFQFLEGRTFSWLAELLWSKKWQIMLASAAGAAAFTLISFMITPKYSAAVTTVWKGDEQQVSGLGAFGGQLGSLASAAGLVPGIESSQNEALAVINSQKFSRLFIEKYDLLPHLFPEKWSKEDGDWRERYVDDPPDLADGVERFDEKIREINQDTRKGTISISIRTINPEDASTWANDFVALANEVLKAQRISEAETSINFLTDQLSTQTSVEIRSSIFKMIESQLGTIVFARARPDFAFRVVDPAVPPPEDREVWPNKPLFLIAGGILGGLLSVLTLSIFAFRSRQ